MRKWEYRVVSSEEVRGGVWKGKVIADVEAFLNQLGHDGWEIVNLDFPLGLDSDRLTFCGVAKREVGA